MKKLFIRAVFAVGVAGLGFSTPIQAQTDIDNTAYGTTSAEFLLLGAGARAAALGGSFAAIANDVTALYWNPGGVAMMERPGAAFSTYTYVAETRYSWAGLAMPFNDGQSAIGIHGATFGFSEQPVYTLENPDGDGTIYSVSQSYVGLTYSQNFSDRFSAGITGKYISDQLGAVSGSTFGVDFGTSFHTEVAGRPIRASFVIQNLGGTISHQGSGLATDVIREAPLDQQDLPQERASARLRTKDFGLPVVFRFALAYDLLRSASTRLTLLSEFMQPNNTDPTANAAFEWALTDIGQSGFTLLARGGYTYQADNVLDATQGAGAGFLSTIESDNGLDGLALGGGLMYARGTFMLGLDYAYRHLGILGGTNYFGATVNW
jgi:hypothetical protein